ncbi:hypothetical protein GM418_19575 [Maribellus comscasis]|uniref:Uncharacterized protein n=1 Tax=Maribellus comscasis TaxID=2681766 RepID=A0A6I6K2P1_9BACT|nr:hypothetical protein [Maribellus comscasis]QGY45793.1 hypothetical protein GM418_19575 [Maribellus comscasis]
MVVLSHEVILHHHHDDVADGLFSNQIAAESPDEKSDERNPDDEHNHPFPLHHHISATSDLVYARINLNESNPLNKITTLFVVTVVFWNDFSEPPDFANNNYENKTFLISSLFNPEANGLRGPPSIV